MVHFPSFKPTDPNADGTESGSKGLLGSIGDMAHKVTDAAKEKAKESVEKAKEGVHSIEDKAKEGVQSIQDKAQEGLDKAKEGLDKIGQATGTGTGTKRKKIGYVEVRDLVVKLVYDDNGIIGKMFLYAETKTGVERRYIGFALLVFVLLYLAIGYGGQLLSNILGFIYPSYASMKAIESKDKGDDTKWLTYWVVFGFVNIAELPLEFILSYIPFFYLFKSLFFVWCFFPVFNGSSVIYNGFLKPFFAEVDKDVTREIADVAGRAMKLGEEIILKYSVGKIPVPHVPHMPLGPGGEKKD